MDVPDPFSDVPDFPAVRRIDRLTVQMDDLVSRMYLFVPLAPRHRLVIFHVGHSHSLAGINGAGTVRFFLDRHYPVLVAFMPLYGPNAGPFNLSLGFHDGLLSLESLTLTPIKYFLEPIVRAVTYAKHVSPSSQVYMIGLSGGGWTTTLAAAVDPRIRISVAVAGSLPQYLRTPPCGMRDVGDFEQHHEPLLVIADYLDLYILASHGFARSHLQVLNQYDACCFSGIRFLTYVDPVQDTVRQVGRGRYELFLDSSHALHQISPHALNEAIYPFVRSVVHDAMGRR